MPSRPLSLPLVLSAAAALLLLSPGCSFDASGHDLEPTSFPCASRPDGSTYCPVACTEDKPCPQGQTCYPTPYHGLRLCGPVVHSGQQPPPQPISVGHKPFFASCSAHGECLSNLCVADNDGGAYCSLYCGAGTVCPLGFFCVPTDTLGLRVCAYY